MRSIPGTMIWELVQHGRWNLLTALLSILGLPLFMMFVFGRQGCLEMDLHSTMIIHGVMILIDATLLGSAVFVSQGSPSRLYVYPVSTRTLAACHLFIGAAVIAAGMLFGTLVLNAVFAIRSPLWAPVVFAAAAYCVFQSSVWYTEKTAWMPVAAGLNTGILGYWYLKRFSRFYESALHASDLTREQLWVEVTATEILVLGAMTIVSYFVGVAALSRNRHGEQIRPLGIIAWILRQLDFDSRLNRPFRSPEEAQAWFEWVKKGWCLPMIMFFYGCIFCIVWIFDPRLRDPRQTIESFTAGGALLSLAGLISGMIVGNLGAIDTEYAMSQFLATRPMSSSNISKVLLKVIGKSVLITWSIWFVAFLIVLTVYSFNGVDLPAILPALFQWWYFPAMLILCWTLMSASASLLMTGRSSLIAKILCLLLTSFIVLGLVTSLTLPADLRVHVFRSVAFAIGTGLLCASGWMFRAAQKQRLIGWPTVVMGTVIWTVLSTFVILECFRLPQHAIPLAVFLIGICALVVVPFAAAPLAVTWNRSR